MGRASKPLPSYMVTEYVTEGLVTLQQIGASYGVDPRQVAAMSGLGDWHHEMPLPPGTRVLMPQFPMPARVMVAAAQNANLDARTPLSDPGAVQVRVQANYLALPNNL